MKILVVFTVALLLTFLVSGIRSPGQLQNAGRDVWAQADQPHHHSDNDGVHDEEEHGPGGTNHNYDGNNDGTPDADQDHVVSYHTHDRQHYVTLACPHTAFLSDAAAVGNPSPGDSPPGMQFPYGFFSFMIHDVDPGGSTTMTLYLPSHMETYYKYGPTPDDPTNHWYEFHHDGETGAEINGNVITLHFVDGKRGDDDLDDTNGTIVDEGAPAAAAISGGDNGGGGGCFIDNVANSLRR
jgi:hypothetical protein